jgi:hypothetical protein
LVGSTDVKEKATLLIVRSIQAGIRRENYKGDEVNFKIGTAMPLFGRNEMKLGTKYRGVGEERKTVGEDEVNLKISNAISPFANVPNISRLLVNPIPDSSLRPQRRCGN